MRYSITYQQLHKGNSRPSDDNIMEAILIEDGGPLVPIPNIGDHVYVENGRDRKETIAGRVRSRFFRYICPGTDPTLHGCHINIVVEEIPHAEYGALVKE
jgi:hypothetical protein